MYICVTEVDYKTGIPCTVEPQRTGPSMPILKGLSILWANESQWPLKLDSNGVYLQAPRYYGICDDDADTSVNGILEVMTEEEWNNHKAIEIQARKPYPSWILIDDIWNPPVALPSDSNMRDGDVHYIWDEPTTSWIAVS